MAQPKGNSNSNPAEPSGTGQQSQTSAGDPGFSLEDLFSNVDAHHYDSSRADALASILISAAENRPFHSFSMSSQAGTSDMISRSMPALFPQQTSSTNSGEMPLSFDAAVIYNKPPEYSKLGTTLDSFPAHAHSGRYGGSGGVDATGQLSAISSNSNLHENPLGHQDGSNRARDSPATTSASFPFSLSDFSSLLNFHTLDKPSAQGQHSFEGHIENFGQNNPGSDNNNSNSNSGGNNKAEKDSSSAATNPTPGSMAMPLFNNFSPASFESTHGDVKAPNPIQVHRTPSYDVGRQPTPAGPGSMSNNNDFLTTPLTANFVNQQQQNSMVSPIAPYFTSIEQAFEAGMKAGNILSNISFGLPGEEGNGGLQNNNKLDIPGQQQQQQSIHIKQQGGDVDHHRFGQGFMDQYSDNNPRSAFIDQARGTDQNATAAAAAAAAAAFQQALLNQTAVGGAHGSDAPNPNAKDAAMMRNNMSAIGAHRMPPMSYGLQLDGSSVPNTSMPYITPATNTRVNQACTTCRRRKVRCNGARPSCMFCSEKGFKCIYEPPSASSRAKGKKRAGANAKSNESGGSQNRADGDGNDPKDEAPRPPRIGHSRSNTLAYGSMSSRKRQYDGNAFPSLDDTDLLGIGREEHRYRMMGRRESFTLIHADEDDDEAYEDELKDENESDNLADQFDKKVTIHELSDRQITLPADMSIRFSMFNLIDYNAEEEIRSAALESKGLGGSSPHQQTDTAEKAFSTKSRAEQALDDYFKFFHPQHPILHRPTFERQVKNGTVDQLLWHCVQAIAGRFAKGNDGSDRKHRVCPYEWGRRHASIAIAMLASASRKPTIETIQSFYLLSLHQLGCGNWMDGITFWGTAARIFNQMQLHMLDEAFTYPGYTSHLGEPESRISNMTKQQSPAHYGREKRLPTTTSEEWIRREMARRLRWKLFESERTFNIGTGRPPLVVLDPGWVFMPCSDKIWELVDPMGLGEQERTLLRICHFHVDASGSIRVEIPRNIKLAMTRRVSTSSGMVTPSASRNSLSAIKEESQEGGDGSSNSNKGKDNDNAMEVDNDDATSSQASASTLSVANSETVISQAEEYLIRVRSRMNRVHLNAHSSIIIGQLTRSRLALFRLFFPCRWPSQFVTKGGKNDPSVDAGGGGGAPGPVVVGWNERIGRMKEAIREIENKIRQWKMYVEAVLGPQAEIEDEGDKEIATAAEMNSVYYYNHRQFEYASYRILAAALGIQARTIVLQLHEALQTNIKRYQQFANSRGGQGGSNNNPLSHGIGATSGLNSDGEFLFTLGRYRTPHDPEPSQGNLAVLDSYASESWIAMTQLAQEIVDLLEIHWRVRAVSKPELRHFVESQPDDNDDDMDEDGDSDLNRDIKKVNVELIDALMGDPMYRPKSNKALSTMFPSKASSNNTGDKPSEKDDSDKQLPTLDVVKELEKCDDGESNYTPYKLQLSSSCYYLFLATKTLIMQLYRWRRQYQLGQELIHEDMDEQPTPSEIVRIQDRLEVLLTALRRSQQFWRSTNYYYMCLRKVRNLLGPLPIERNSGQGNASRSHNDGTRASYNDYLAGGGAYKHDNSPSLSSLMSSPHL